VDEIGCSFCGKRRSEVRKLISGPNVYVCDECVALCNDIIEQERESPAAPIPRHRREVLDELDRYVISQDRAKRVMFGRCIQPLQADFLPQQAWRCRAGQREYSASRANGLWENASRPDIGQEVGCSFCDG